VSELANPAPEHDRAAGGETDGPDGPDDLTPRRSRTGLVVSVVVALVLIGFVAVLATRDPATDRRASSPLIGRVAPPLVGETLDGEAFDIGDHRGRWVVVNFFATWCQPCIQEHPELVAFDEAHRPTDYARVVSVLYSDDPGTARKFFDRNGGDWPVVIDRDGRIALAYGVPKVPETYLVDPTGRVVEKLTGGVTRQGLENVIVREARAAREAGS